MKKVMVVFFMLLMGSGLLAKGSGYTEAPDLFKTKSGEKKAIILVSFGTTHADTRAKTINALETQFKEEFPDFKVVTAFTSRIIMRRVKANEGIVYNNPSEALDILKKEGYTHVLVQATHIMNGEESEVLGKEVALHMKDFKVLRVGRPLLNQLPDYKAVAEALAPKYNSLKENKFLFFGENEATVFIGHGTSHPGNATYSMMEDTFHEFYSENVFIATVEGYPTLTSVIRKLKKQNITHVNLYPFMIVAGTHARDDIATEMKAELEKEGFTVTAPLVGLGENEAIRKIYIQHAKFVMTHEKVDMLAKKKKYSEGMQP
ncbi:MAG: sirohydrochlorin cobaltochelatase [Psychrilyobacter sp.]|nr:sirohydrochlorin cobaltochelatase [Psychrilyobacter sp.]